MPLPLIPEVVGTSSLDPVLPGPVKLAPPIARHYVRVMQRGFLTINNDTFLNLAWHHLAYSEKGIEEIEE